VVTVAQEQHQALLEHQSHMLAVVVVEQTMV
jgi:hypothetical protein